MIDKYMKNYHGELINDVYNLLKCLEIWIVLDLGWNPAALRSSAATLHICVVCGWNKCHNVETREGQRHDTGFWCELCQG